MAVPWRFFPAWFVACLLCASFLAIGCPAAANSATAEPPDRLELTWSLTVPVPVSAQVPGQPSPVPTQLSFEPLSARPAYLTPGLVLLGVASLVDGSLYDAVHRHQDPGRRAFFGAVTHLGDGLMAAGLTLGLRAFDPVTADHLGRATLRAGLATTVLKLVIARPRPREDPAACSPGFTLHACVSMPSGHAAVAFSMARVLAHQYPDYGPLFYLLAVLAAWSRVEVEQHWPSDVVAGALIGLWAADTILSQARDQEEAAATLNEPATALEVPAAALEEPSALAGMP